jgi:hypothetical protein
MVGLAPLPQKFFSLAFKMVHFKVVYKCMKKKVS